MWISALFGLFLSDLLDIAAASSNYDGKNQVRKRIGCDKNTLFTAGWSRRLSRPTIFFFIYKISGISISIQGLIYGALLPIRPSLITFLLIPRLVEKQ